MGEWSRVRKGSPPGGSLSGLDGSQLRRVLAIGLYAEGAVSLEQAAELAGMEPSALEASLAARLDHLAQEDGSPDGHPLLSVVIPVLDEEDNLPKLAETLLPVLQHMGTYEVIFVDDGSTDRSAELVRELRRGDPAVKLIRFSRNFGHQAALSAGLDHATGEAVVFMDCDLQDPPELLPDFVARWREGYEVVYAIREKRREGWIKRFMYFSFYRLLRAIADIRIPLDSGDFCLLDRRAADQIRRLPEKNRFLRGLRTWIGFRQVGVPFDRPARFAGKPKYSIRKLMRLALDGLFSFSSVPLRIASYLGLLTAGAGIVYLVVAVVARIFVGRVPQGWTSIIAIMLILGGIQLVVMAILGQYLARVYDETKERPVYVIDDRVGI